MTSSSTEPRLTIEVWSDVVCPWCYIGDARLKKAIEASGKADRTDVVIRGFQLDPTQSAEPVSAIDYLAGKFGKSRDEAQEMDGQVAQLAVAEGLPYTSDHPMRNTLDALRVVHHARENGVGWEMMKALQHEVFGGNQDAFAHDVIVRIGGELGLDESSVREVLEGDRHAEAVISEQQEATALGARGVPFTVLDRRLGIPGAVPQEMYEQALAQAWSTIDD